MAVLLFFEFVLLPRSFAGNRPITFGEIIKPYIPYLLYTMGLWIGNGFLVFLVLIRMVPQDWKEWRDSASKLDRASAVKPLTKVESRREAFGDLLLTFQDHVARIKDLAERYIPLLLVIALYLLYEQLTPSYKTLTPLSVEAGKVAVWVILGPAFIISLISVAFGYQNTAERAERGFRVLIGASDESSREDSDLLGKLLNARDALLWERSPGKLVLSVGKSATLSIPLLFTIVAYVIKIKTLEGPETWVGVFAPKAVVHFFETLYK